MPDAAGVRRGRAATRGTSEIATIVTMPRVHLRDVVLRVEIGDHAAEAAEVDQKLEPDRVDERVDQREANARRDGRHRRGKRNQPKRLPRRCVEAAAHCAQHIRNEQHAEARLNDDRQHGRDRAHDDDRPARAVEHDEKQRIQQHDRRGKQTAEPAFVCAAERGRNARARCLPECRIPRRSALRQGLRRT